jgi:hypothetical protein
MALRSRVECAPSRPSLDVPLRNITMRPKDVRPARPATLAERVRGEFAEMQGFSPTVEQASRLFDLPKDDCRSVLSSLVDEGFLHRTPEGRYRRSPR